MLPLAGLIKKYGFANLILYTAAIAFAVIVKIYYRQVESFPGDPAIMLFLKPLSTIVGLFFGIPFEFDASKGFFNKDINVVIGTSCAGINFFVIVFCMLTFTFIKLFRSIRQNLPDITVVSPYRQFSACSKQYR